MRWMVIKVVAISMQMRFTIWGCKFLIQDITTIIRACNSSKLSVDTDFLDGYIYKGSLWFVISLILKFVPKAVHKNVFALHIFFILSIASKLYILRKSEIVLKIDHSSSINYKSLQVRSHFHLNGLPLLILPASRQNAIKIRFYEAWRYKNPICI